MFYMRWWRDVALLMDACIPVSMIWVKNVACWFCRAGREEDTAAPNAFPLISLMIFVVDLEWQVNLKH